ncbi:unannotated protein [freshwater metagenome]|uniref:Unannotated protein n=1 Tax=freshwater metagenome TaxID=449393 RepID=A0A6J7V7M6_9ZZZZ|nr:hypothetical protein [Actinomycetota bacterium]MSY87100.1 hypothetical protein [Actinomycetota bacterium]MTA50430.1 hypothetical protein [Actinomycetota bacterium]
MKSTLSATTLRLASGEVTSQELVKNALEVIDEHHAVEQRIEYARIEALEADSRRANGLQRSSIDGIPFGVKANIDIKGVVTTSGTRSNEVKASVDSWIVSRLRELGAIPTLTTTMAEGAVGAVTANAFTGLCSNPLDPRLNAGGSSGGSAAIVGSEVLPFSLGSDTMGSVRIPAAYCEIVGYKPSRGRISNQGLVRLAEEFDSVGFLTTSVSDLVAILSAAQNIAYSPIDPSTLRIVGSQLSRDADPLGQSAVHQILSKLASLEERTIEGFDAGAIRRAGLLICELEGSESLGLSGSTTQQGFSEEFLSIMNFVNTLPPRKIAETKAKIAEFQSQTRALFKTFDVMVLPTTAAGAPALSANPPNAADLAAWVNISGLSSLSIVEPTTRRSVQLVGESDENVLNLGLWLEREFNTTH